MDLRSRRSGTGFSLDDAASVRRAVLQAGATPGCPRCAVPLEQTGGTAGEEHVWMMRCPRCGAGLVIQAPTARSTG